MPPGGNSHFVEANYIIDGGSAHTRQDLPHKACVREPQPRYWAVYMDYTTRKGVTSFRRFCCNAGCEQKGHSSNKP